MDLNLTIGNMKTLQSYDDSVNNLFLYKGDVVADYKIIKLLGNGGMGQVYLVENTQMHKKYAMKILFPKFCKNKNFIKCFKIEARIMADLKHPNIVAFHHAGFDIKHNLYYFVMEYIDSVNSEKIKDKSEENPSDLESILKNKKKLPENLAVKITKQLCSALDYAHSFQGKCIIHRDLKPSNILIDAERNAYIADFGIAKIKEDFSRDFNNKEKYLGISLGEMKTVDFRRQTTDGRDGCSQPSANNILDNACGGLGTDTPYSITNNLKPSTSIVGTYEYMSPEQQEGKDAMVQSDIYSLGLIIYQMLTGKQAKRTL